MSDWKPGDMPAQSGKTIIVTGGNSGLGFESVKALAGKGATVILAARNAAKAEAAKEAIDAEAPSGTVVVMPLDLSSFASIRAFASAFDERFDRLDVLMNNAGVMAIASNSTQDGFEMQIGTNHFGHFLLTGLLLQKLLNTPSSRVVALTSIAANYARMRVDDLNFERRAYGRWGVYNQTKLANMLFVRELDRRLKKLGDSHTIAVAAHPGLSATNLQQGPADGAGAFGRLLPGLLHQFCQPQAQGAHPQLRAATEPGLVGDELFGPRDRMNMKGPAVKLDYPRTGRDMGKAAQLWTKSVELTGEDFGGI